MHTPRPSATNPAPHSDGLAPFNHPRLGVVVNQTIPHLVDDGSGRLSLQL